MPDAASESAPAVSCRCASANTCGHARVDVQRTRLGRGPNRAVITQPAEPAVRRGSAPRVRRRTTGWPRPVATALFLARSRSFLPRERPAGRAHPILSGSGGPGENGPAAYLRLRVLDALDEPFHGDTAEPGRSRSSTVTGGVSASAMGKSPNPTTAMSVRPARCRAWTSAIVQSVVAENTAVGAFGASSSFTSSAAHSSAEPAGHADQVGTVEQSQLGHGRAVALEPAAHGRDGGGGCPGRPPGGDRDWRDA